MLRTWMNRPCIGSGRTRLPPCRIEPLPRRSRQIVPGFVKSALTFVIWSQLARVGEALVPGPVTPTNPVLGTFNGGGILHKADLVGTLPPGLWTTSETHLTYAGAKKFQYDLKCRGSNMRFIPGHPAPPLSDSSISLGGKCTGVGILSTYPVRAMTSEFEPDLWRTGRIQVAAACVQGTWIKVGTAYGYSACNKNQATMAQTDALLGELTTRIVFQSHGPRMIAGDFNAHQSLPQMEIWKMQGFVELQQLALAKWGQTPKPTYRDQTIVDQVWISAELVPFIDQVCVDATFFADHAILYASLSGLPSMPKVSVWRQPHAMPWDTVPTDTPFPGVAIPDVNNTQFIPQIFAIMEEQVNTALVECSKAGLLPQQRGRATQVMPKRLHTQPAPLRRSRTGDVQVQFQGENFHHTHWCRQLRRLQSFGRAAASHKSDASSINHRTALWSAIRDAPGFAKGFPHMWLHRTCDVAGAPRKLPRKPPDAECAAAIFQAFHKQFTQLETLLIRGRVHKAKQVRRTHENVGFRDVAMPRAMPVQTLAMPKVAHVVEVDYDTNQAHYNPEVLDCTAPVFGNAGLLQLQTHTPGCCTFTEADQIQPGDTLHQTEYVGDPALVLENFNALWSPMWNKHEHTPDDRWADYIRLIKTHVPVPDHQLELPPITVEQWISTVRSKKTVTACGPDGITRLDLLRMPPHLTEALVRHVNLLDRGEIPWHPAALTGLIALIEKKEGACVPQDFRPICVLSMLYRTWSSLRARQCLQFLHRIAPDNQFGNRPNKSAKNVWWQVAQLIEAYNAKDWELAGVITDIVKCFNNLPRFPIAFAARWLKFPRQFVAAWFHVTGSISRRFVVAGSVGNAIPSVTGFPEGDPLSVVAMAVYNVTMHWILSAQIPSARFLSFVDNWEAICPTAEDVQAAAEAMIQFASTTDVTLDLRKTETWCITHRGRKVLKKGSFGTVLATRNLGGQMVYCKRRIIAQIRGRIQRHAVLWDWMRRSHSPTSFKMRMLHTVAWPRCLHGISNLHVGNDHFVKLRAAAMQAMQWTKKGASSMLQFALNRDLRADPGYFSMEVTFKDFRAMHDPSVAFPLLNELAILPKMHHAQGPCSALLARISQLGWRWEGNGFVSDHEQLEWSLVDCPIQWLILRLKQAWALQHGGQYAKRHTFEGLQMVDLAFTHEGIDQWSPAAQGFLRTVHNGTFYTRDVQFYTGRVATQDCPWCNQRDGIRHRNWECVHFDRARQHIDPDLREAILQEPPCFHLRGWVVETVEHAQFRRMLHHLPDGTEDVVQVPTATDDIHLFTDGSCLTPGRQCTRLATWGVCLARLDHFDFPTVASGPVPGGCHTTLRAELCAAIAACHYGLEVGKPFTLWIDNESVYKGLCRMLTGTFAVAAPKKPNHDLWNKLLAKARQAVGRGLFKNVVKVRSHENEMCYPDAVEKWAIKGNAAADAAAELEHEQFYPGLLAVRDRLCQKVVALTRMRDAMRKLLVEIGHQSVAGKAEVQTFDNAKWEETLAKPRDVDEAQLSLTGLPDTLPFDRHHSLGEHAQALFDWMHKLVRGGSGIPMWLSSHQLLVHFQIFMGKRGYKFNQRTNRWDDESVSQDESYEFHKGANAFQAIVKCLALAIGVPFRPQQRLPAGSIYRCWINCIQVVVDESVIHHVNNLIRERGGNNIKAVKKTMSGWSDFVGAPVP